MRGEDSGPLIHKRMMAGISAAGILALGIITGDAHEVAATTTLPITRDAGFLAGSYALTVDVPANRIFAGDTRSGSVRILTASTGGVVRTVALGTAPQALAVDPATRRVFVVTRADRPDTQGSVTMLDEGSGKVLRTVTVGVDPRAVAVDVTTGRVFVTNLHGVSVVDASTGALLRTIPTSADELSVAPVAIDKQTGQVFAASSATNASGQAAPGASIISVLDAATGTLRRRIPITNGPIAVSVDERTRRAFTSNLDGSVSILDVQTDRLVRTIPLAPLAVAPAVAVDSQSGRAFVAGYDYTTYHGHISTLNVRSGNLLKTVAVGNTANAVAVAERVNHVFALSESGVSMLDARSGNLLRTTPIRPSPDAVVVDARSGRVFVSDSEGRVHIFDARSGNLLRTSVSNRTT